MEAVAFSLCYLGGRIDLLRAKERLQKYYPENNLFLLKNHRVWKVLLKNGELPEIGEFALHLHLFEDGMGLITLAPKLKDKSSEFFNNPFDFLFNNPALSEAISLFIKRSESGVEFIPVGEDGINRGVGPGNGILIVDKDMGKEIIQEGIRVGPDVYLYNRYRFFTPRFSPKLLSDLLLFFYKEFGIARYRGILSDWIRSLWTLIKEKKGLEKYRMNFNLYLSQLFSFLLKNEKSSYGIFDQDRIEGISIYKRERALILSLIERVGDILKTSPELPELRRELQEIKSSSTFTSLLIAIASAFLILFLSKEALWERVVVSIALIAGSCLYFLSYRYRRSKEAQKLEEMEVERERLKRAEMEKRMEMIKSLEDVPEEVKESYLQEIGR